jgi:hypothetical protein
VQGIVGQKVRGGGSGGNVSPGKEGRREMAGGPQANKLKQNRSDQNRTEQNRMEQNRTKQNRTKREEIKGMWRCR